MCDASLPLLRELLANLVRGQRKLNVIASIHEHIGRESDQLGPKSPLHFTDQDRFAIPNARLGDNAYRLPVDAMDRQVEKPRSHFTSRYGLRFLGNALADRVNGLNHKRGIFFELGRNARVNSDSARHSGLYFYYPCWT